MIVRSARVLGAVIRERRLELGLNQEELAERAGVGRRWIVEVEKGKPRAQIELLLATLRALDLDMDVSRAPPEATDPASDLDRVVDEARES